MNRLSAVVAVALVSCGLLLSPTPLLLAQAPDPSSLAWRAIAPSTAPPPGRSDAAVVYDRVRDRVIVFGGRSGSVEFDDTWAFDLATRTWTDLTAATRPVKRFSMIAGIDAARDRLVISTGESAGAFLNDAWALDLTTDRWSLIAASGGPPTERYGAAGGIYSPRGVNGTALYFSHGFNAGRFDDLWALDLATDTWRDVSPPTAPPPARCLHASAMLDDDSMLLFGGCVPGVGCGANDLWLFDRAAAAWTELTPATGNPAGRLYPSLVAVGQSGTAILFGGSGTRDLNDAWVYDPAVGTWQALTPGGTPPAGRHGHGAAWVDGPASTPDACAFMLVFGGQIGTTSASDLYALAPPTAPPVEAVVYAVRAGADVAFSWSHDPANVAYELWRSPDRTVTPAVLLTEPITVVGTNVTTTDATSDPIAGNYYQARSLSCAP